MSDVPSGHLRYHEIDIPARFIRQASEHIDHTQARWVTFIFTGENTEDAVCAGVTTRLMIADQRPRMARQPQPASEPPEPQVKRKRKTPTAKSPRLKDISDDMIVAIIRQAPASTAEICHALGVPTSDVPVRQKIWRVVTKLGATGALGRKGNERNAKWIIADDAANTTADQPQMPVRHAKRKPTRKQISEDMVLNTMREGNLTSKTVSDSLGIPRNDVSTRGRVTEHIRHLKDKGTIRRTERMTDGGPVYELYDETAMTAAG